MHRLNRLLQIVVALAVACGLATQGFAAEPVAAKRNTGLWDVAELSKTPEAKWGDAQEGVQEVYYAGEPYRGKPTRVFAYFAKPEGEGPFPAVVLVHGGGGKAFRDWAVHWQKRGYAALAMDLAGQGPSGRLEDGGPDPGDDAKFRKFSDDDARDMWTYHAVANVIRGHSLLAARKEVDPQRTALTGISWGGYLTCIVAGIDARFQAAVPVYGCGFLAESSVWKDRMSKMTAEERERWTSHWDPSQYVGGAACPMLFLNGTNDFAYPLDSYKKTYQLPKSPVTISVVPRLMHGHFWRFPVVDLFIDSAVNKGVPLPKLDKMEISEGTASAMVESPTKLVGGELHYAKDDGPWPHREWQSVPAKIEEGRITATLPSERPILFYLSVTDDRGAMVTTQHESAQ